MCVSKQEGGKKRVSLLADVAPLHVIGPIGSALPPLHAGHGAGAGLQAGHGVASGSPGRPTPWAGGAALASAAVTADCMSSTDEQMQSGHFGAVSPAVAHGLMVYLAIDVRVLV